MRPSKLGLMIPLRVKTPQLLKIALPVKTNQLKITNLNLIMKLTLILKLIRLRNQLIKTKKVLNKLIKIKPTVLILIQLRLMSLIIKLQMTIKQPNLIALKIRKQIILTPKNQIKQLMTLKLIKPILAIPLTSQMIANQLKTELLNAIQLRTLPVILTRL